MTVTTSYSLEFVADLSNNFFSGTGDQSVVTDITSSGFGGGYLTTVDHFGHTDIEFRDAAGLLVGSSNVLTGTNASTDQLTNGNYVITTQDADSIRYAVYNSSGGVVVAQVDIGTTGDSNADVAASGFGGFAIVEQHVFAGSDIDIHMRIYDNAGVLQHTVSVDSSGGSTDTEPTIAALDDGNYAIAWTRTVAGETEIRYAVVGANGTIIKASTLLDTTGTINQHPSITASDGGFTIAYEDNGWDGETDITIAEFNLSGTFQTWTQLSGGSGEANPYITRLDGGVLAIGFEENSFADTDNRVYLFDSANNTLFSAAGVTGGQSLFDDVANISLAWDGTHLFAQQSNLTDLSVNGSSYNTIRTFNGDAGADAISVNSGYVTDVFAGAGDDTVTIFGGNTNQRTLDGGANNDTLIYSGESHDTVVDLAAGTYSNIHGNFTFTGFENFSAINDSSNFTISGSNGANGLTGQAGFDSIAGLDGADTLTGRGGDDTLDGGIGLDTMFGGTGNDTYYVDELLDVADETGGDGTADIVYASVGYTIASGIENLTLTGGALRASGNAGDNILTGNASNNTFYAGGGNDTVIGGDGNDRMAAGTGDDSMVGGNGNDIYFVDSLLDTVDESTGSGTADEVRTTLNGYTLGSDIERLRLGAGVVSGNGNGNGNDLLGNGLGNDLRSFAGADRVYGYGGNDTIRGGNGADSIYGGGGSDQIYGGIDRDVMRGDTGNDIFFFNDGDFSGVTNATADRIVDFTQGQDIVNLSLADAIVGGANNSFSFIGTQAFHGIAGELRYVQSAGVTLILGDTNGDSVADMGVALTGTINLVASDFVL